MRPPPPAPGAELSVLVDIGSAWTKASVIGRSRGRWRIAAHAAQPTSWDEGELWRTLAAHLAAGADRRLHERLERLVAEAPRIECHTPRRPARLALAAVSRDISGAAARRAAESAGWVVEEVASMDDDRSLAARLGALQSADVDAWLVSGGFDDAHSEQALEMAALVAAARRGGETPVIWAGSARLGAEVGRLFEPAPVSLVANPRPSPDRSEPTALRHHLEALLQEM
ncbi:MAG TPA: glutamate mutase L, partial [Candidatus Limnocylindria bacterium]|nr:glutamate mutase L [Candidatus Limnocylindria bacterium]